jgi:thiamine biosynthesis protein ThiS
MGKIKIEINGEEKEINENSTIQDILDDLKITSPMVVVERNFEIIPKEQYCLTLNESDKLEIVGFFGGG